MSSTVDVNILVCAADEMSPRHDRARALLDHVASNQSITYVFWPVLLGYVRIVTHPSIVESPLSPEEAINDIEDLLRRPQIVVVGEGDRFWTTFRSVAGQVRPRGNLVSDAHLVALMKENGVSTIWSHDRDFRKFPGITVKDPYEDRYAAGFN